MTLILESKASVATAGGRIGGEHNSLIGSLPSPQAFGTFTLVKMEALKGRLCKEAAGCLALKWVDLYEFGASLAYIASWPARATQ